MENLHAVLHFNIKNFALNYAQDFRTTLKESLIKELRARSGLHSRKVELSRVKYFHAFVSTLNYVSPIGANGDKRRRSWDVGGLDRELSTSLATNYEKRRNQLKTKPPASRDYVFLFAIFLKS